MVQVLLEKETIYADEIDMIMKGSTKEEVVAFIDNKAKVKKESKKPAKKKEKEESYVDSLIKEAEKRAEKKGEKPVEETVKQESPDKKKEDENKGNK